MSSIITFEEFKEIYQRAKDSNFTRSREFNELTGYNELHGFLTYPNDYTIERSKGLTEEEALILLYKKSILNEPLDSVYTKLSEGDTVLTKYGMLGKIIKISPKGYLTIVLKGSDRIVKRKSDVVVKVDPNIDLSLP